MHSSINWQLGFISLLAIVNNAAMNTVVQISLWDPAFNSLGYLGMRLLEYMGVLSLNFWGMYIPFFIAAAPFTFLPVCIPTACRSLSSPHSLQPLFFSIILIVVIQMGMRWHVNVVFSCISLIVGDVAHPFVCLLVILISHLENCPFWIELSGFCLFVCILIFFCYWISGFLMYCEY